MAVAICKRCGERTAYNKRKGETPQQLTCLVCAARMMRRTSFPKAGRVWCESCGEQLDQVEVNRVVGRALCGPCQFRLQGSK